MRDLIVARGRRLFYLALLALGMFVLSVVDQRLLLEVVAVVLIVLPIFNLLAVVILVYAARQAPEVRSLSSRADDAIALALASIAVAILVWVALLGLNVPGAIRATILAFALVVISIPAVDWLRVWADVWWPLVRDRFRGSR